MSTGNLITRWQTYAILAAVFMAGVTLGRWSMGHEWFYILASIIYVFAIASGAHSIHRSFKKDEAELREMLREIEEAEKERDAQ